MEIAEIVAPFSLVRKKKPARDETTDGPQLKRLVRQCTVGVSCVLQSSSRSVGA